MTASQLGSRQLYLHDPYFMGEDVLTLQTALATLGFVCPVDGAFDIGTEHAVLDFQMNMSLYCDGIVGVQTANTIQQLSHAWRDKDVRSISSIDLSNVKPQSRGQDIVCVYGTDPLARLVAERLANRAQVASPAERIVSPASLEAALPTNAFMIELSSSAERIGQLKSAGQPVLRYSTSSEFGAALAACWAKLVRVPERRVVVEITELNTTACATTALVPTVAATPNDELIQQRLATTILDAILSVLL